MARPRHLAWLCVLPAGLLAGGLLAGGLLASGLLASGCAFDMPPADPPSPSREQFDAEVYPVLLRDCGFTDCHGSRDRFFRVFGPRRRRFDPSVTGLDAPATEDELALAYDRARSMLAGAHTPEETLLLRKPLEIDAGGAPHRGIDAHGQDVYGSPDDEGYQVLLRWARTGFAGP